MRCVGCETVANVSQNTIISALNARGIRYKLRRNLSGQMAVYAQTIGATVLPTGTPVNTTNLVTAINDGLTTQSVDFDPSLTRVSYLGMALSDTYYPEAWVNMTVTANGNLGVLRKDGTLIAPAILGALVLGLVLGFFVVDTYWQIYKAEHTYSYRDPNDGTIKTIIGEAPFISTINSLYWIPCEKDGTGVGLRSKYATLAEYQASPEYPAEYAYIKDHCANAQDIVGAGLNNWMSTLIFGAAVIGGIYLIARILPSFLSKKGG